MAYSACPQRNPSFSCTVLCYFNKNIKSFLMKAVLSVCFFSYIFFKIYLYIVYICTCIANYVFEKTKTSYSLERGSRDDKQRNSLPSGFAALSSLLLSVLLGDEIVNF